MSSHKQKPRRLSTATAVLSALLAMTCVNKPAVSAGPPFDWGNWDGILRTRLKPAVRFGVPLTGLDYRGLRRSRGSFDKVVAALARYQPTGIRARREKLSFWISAYNVGTVKVVLDNPKLTGIRQVGSIFRSVWKTKVIVIGGKSMSLDQIEHAPTIQEDPRGRIEKRGRGIRRQKSGVQAPHPHDSPHGTRFPKQSMIVPGIEGIDTVMIRFRVGVRLPGKTSAHPAPPVRRSSAA